MGNCHYSPNSSCQNAVHRMNEVFDSGGKPKLKAKAIISVLKLAVRPFHAELLYKCGAADACSKVLKLEPKGSQLRELSLVTLLCLTLDPFIKHDIVGSDNRMVIEYVISVVRQEKSGTSIKYAGIAVLHSLTRDERNLPILFAEDDFIETLIESITYESEGSPLRKLACEIILAFSKVKIFQPSLWRSFNEVASRLLIGEIGTPSTCILEISISILSNLAFQDGIREAIIRERVIMNCLGKVLENKSADSPKLKSATLEFFYELANGSESVLLRMTQLGKLPLSLSTYIEPTTPLKDDCGLTAIKIFHKLSSFSESRRFVLHHCPSIVDILIVHTRTNLFARLAYINFIGAFREDDSDDHEIEPLRGCEDMDDKIVELLENWVNQTWKLKEEDEDDDEEFPEENMFDPNFTLLSLSVLLKRRDHMRRIGSKVQPVILRALEKALQVNDVRSVSFALQCIRLLAQEKEISDVQLEDILALLGKVQEKVHPSWTSVRIDAERLISRLSTTGTTFSRLIPVVDMLERVLDNAQNGSSWSLDVPLSSLTYTFSLASKEEKLITSKKLVKLLPRALSRAVTDEDRLSAMYAYSLIQNITKNIDALFKNDWESDTPALSVALSDALEKYNSQYAV